MPKPKPKYWLSDGPEQALLEQLFREKKVFPHDMPSEIQSKYSDFGRFSGDVFRKHWGLTKKKLYSGCKYKKIIK